MRPCGSFDTKYSQSIAIIHTPLQWAMWIAFLCFVIAFPFFADSYYTMVAIITSIATISVLGLNIVTGYTGLLNIGQAAFMAVGAYASAIFVTQWGWNFFPALLVGSLVSSGVGVIFGAPSLRVKGFYLALATLAAHFIIIWILMEWFGGATGYAVPRPSAFGFVFESDHSYYYLVCGLAILLGIFAKNLIRSRIGRAFIAIRDHDIAAEILGINVFRYKLLAFAVGCFYAGVAGTLLGHFYLYVNIESFPITDSIWYLGMVIVGGMGSIMGSVFGAVFLTILQEISITLAPIIEGILPEGLAMYQMQAALGWLFYGIVIIVFVIFEPRGLAHRWQLMKASYRLNPFPY